MRRPSLLLLAASLALAAPSWAGAAEGPKEGEWSRGDKVFWLNAAELGVLTGWGLYAWQYGARATPHTRWEGGFGEETKHGGSDKVCHAFTGYLVGRTFAGAYEDWGYERDKAALMGVGSSLLFTTMIELGDSFSDYGASPEDLVANVAGAGVGYLFARYPQAGRFIDWRLEYWPKYNRLPADPSTDYERMKHHLVLKLSGFEELGDSWLSFGEVHAGYYTRGFTGARKSKERDFFLGVGVNLSRLFEASPVSSVFKYYQLPLTYASAGAPL